MDVNMPLCMSDGEIDTSPEMCMLIDFHFKCELKENRKEILNSLQIFTWKCYQIWNIINAREKS